MTVAVKICGLTNAPDIWNAVEAGADYLGFVFSPSPRQMTSEKVAALISDLPKQVLTVGVFVNEPLHRVNSISEKCSLDIVQLQGIETAAYCKQCNLPVFKGVHIGGENSETDYPVAALLYDTFVTGKSGGTGQTFDWSIVLKRCSQLPFFVAGGLTPDNVRDAICATQPNGVDVSSGVALNARRKDPQLVRAFIEAAKQP